MKDEVQEKSDMIIIGDFLDNINQVRDNVMPVVTLMSVAIELNPNIGPVLTSIEVGNLGSFLKNQLEELFKATDGIYEVYRDSVSR